MNRQIGGGEPGDGGGDLAVIGEGTPNRTSISIQVLQNIYHELTGKSEEVAKSYDEPFCFERADFEQLNHRVLQACEQFNVCSSNCSIKVFYINDTQDTFSSFDRFQAFNSGNTSPIESVLFTYNFLLLLPKLNQPQSYSLAIRVASRVSIEKQMREDMPVDMPRIWRLMRGRNALVTVKYVDYVVARTLLNVADEWFKTVRKSPFPGWWKGLIKRSSYIPLVSRYVVGALAVLTMLLALPQVLTVDATFLDFGYASLLGFAGLFGAYKLAGHFGSGAEDSLDSWAPISYVKLTAGDSAAIADAVRFNQRSLWGAVLKFTGSILVSVVVKIIVDLAVGT